MKSASGVGSIRKKTVTESGKQYTYWEARYTAGYDPGTGKQIQRSITGKTQKEVARKLRDATKDIDEGTYTAPNKMTLSAWMDIWTQDYLGDVKPLTANSYRSISKNHIKPGLGAVRLDSLQPHMIQRYYNQNLQGLSVKTIRNIHGVLHKALQQAVENNYLKSNPVDACKIPKAEKANASIHPMDENQIHDFLQAIRGSKYEDLFLVTLFTGMRQSEVLGLQWDDVDLDAGTITIRQQLLPPKVKGGDYVLASPKNGKARTITVAKTVVKALRNQHRQQLENKLKLGECYEDSGFVFTDEIGRHLVHVTVYKAFKKIADQIGCPDTRFHDLRHSYAVASLQAGDDIKTVQENLGHATAAFTLDVYGYVTEKMKKDSADRMEKFIEAVND